MYGWKPPKNNQTSYYTTLLLRITIPTSLDIFPTPNTSHSPTCYTNRIHSHFCQCSLTLPSLTIIPRATYVRAGLSNWFCPSSVRPSSVVCNKKIFITGDLESIMTSKWDKSRRILAYAYLVEHEVVLFSTFF